MAILGNEADVMFFNVIHQLVGSPDKEGPVERREGLRQPFLVVQRIAPGFHQEIPPDSAFMEIRCHDLTQSGFSFLLPQAPDFDRLVAALGRPPSVIHVAAEVLHCSEVRVYPSGAVEGIENWVSPASAEARQGQPSKRMVLVGCRFIRRLGD
jgi:hypothetical protein